VTVLGGLLARSEERAIQATTWGTWQGDDFLPTWSGANVDNDSAIRHLTVYGCARFIADGIGTLPVDTFRSTSDGPVPLSNPRWLEEPFGDLDRVAWCGQVLLSLLLAGNAYCWRDFTPSGQLTLRPLNPDQVSVRADGGRKLYTIAGNGPFDSMRVLHIPGLMWPGSDVGLSPVEMARQTVGIGMSAEEFGARFFGQGAVMSGVIEVPADQPPEKSREMAKGWARHHSGKAKSHLPGVLTGGATWKQTSITNEQAQFLDTRKFTASQIASQMFLIDPAEMGLPVDGSSLTYANLEQRNARKVQVTFLPWLVRLERALSAELAAPRYVKFNVGGLLRGDMKTRFDSYRVALGPDVPFMEPNEARAFEDWQPLPEEALVVAAPEPRSRRVERDELGQVVRVVEE